MFKVQKINKLNVILNGVENNNSIYGYGYQYSYTDTGYYTEDEQSGFFLFNWINKINPQNWEIKYKKGLAALVDDEYNEIINNPKLLSITKDDLSRESLNIWFGKDSDLRKKELI